MKKFCVLIAIILAAGQIFGFQKTKPEAIPNPALTAEEKEILKNREMLGNLDLLRDFDKFRYFDLFIIAPDADENKECVKPETKQTKKDEKKKK